MKFHLYAFLIINFATINLFASPVSENGVLKTNGSQIVGSQGDAVQVAGPSLYWSIWGGQNFYNKNVVNKVAKDWNASLIRAAIAVEFDGGYLKKPEKQLEYAKAAVDAAIENGIYILVDWHDHNANLHIPQAKEFFNEMAKTYKDTPNVIWEIWNEPDNENGTADNGYDTWDDIKNYADSIIPVIRKYSSNLIVVGTPRWSSDPLSASKKPLEDSNVAYTLHFYAGSHGASVRSNAEKAMQNGVALFITEFGTTDASAGKEDGKLYFNETKTWLDWADLKGISWANWSLSNINEPASELKPTAKKDGSWSDEDLSVSGLWIRERLLQRSPDYNSDSAIIITSISGNGTVSVSPDVKRVKKGTKVTFTAKPSEGWEFKSWSNGSSSKENPLEITIEESFYIVANFTGAEGSNMIQNGDFSTESLWSFWVDEKNGNDATYEISDGRLVFSISATDTEANWGIQVSQSGLNLQKGAEYEISLDAWSDDERDLFVGLTTATTWYFQGGNTLNLTKSKQTFNVTCNPDSSTDEGILQILAGGSVLPVYVDNIKMIKTKEASIKNSNGAKKSFVKLNQVKDRIYWTSSIKNPKVMITDLRGRIIQQQTISNPVMLKKLPKGIFLFIVKNDVQKQVFKFVY